MLVDLLLWHALLLVLLALVLVIIIKKVAQPKQHHMDSQSLFTDPNDPNLHN
ncbi:MAG: hypothetical protein ACO1OC_09470 [Tuberibacillus sp.]